MIHSPGNVADTSRARLHLAPGIGRPGASRRTRSIAQPSPVGEGGGLDGRRQSGRGAMRGCAWSTRPPPSGPATVDDFWSSLRRVRFCYSSANDGTTQFTELWLCQMRTQQRFTVTTELTTTSLAEHRATKVGTGKCRTARASDPGRTACRCSGVRSVEGSGRPVDGGCQWLFRDEQQQDHRCDDQRNEVHEDRGERVVVRPDDDFANSSGQLPENFRCE
ncbi:hypothetical protein ABH922_001939 [Rhodococcus sp. 27YEA15]